MIELAMRRAKQPNESFRIIIGLIAVGKNAENIYRLRTGKRKLKSKRKHS